MADWIEVTIWGFFWFVAIYAIVEYISDLIRKERSSPLWAVIAIWFILLKLLPISAFLF